MEKKCLFTECLARRVLDKQKIVKKDDFDSSDKPDWINSDKVGIEVTIDNESIGFTKLIENVNSREDISSIKVFNRTYEEMDGCIINREIAEMLEINYSFPRIDYENVYIPPTFDLDFKHARNSFCNKLNKLNTIYSYHDKNYLFIFSICFEERVNFEEELNNLSEIQKDFKYKFQKVYVFILRKLYELDLVEKKVQTYSFNNDDIRDIFINAKMDKETIEKELYNK